MRRILTVTALAAVTLVLGAGPVLGQATPPTSFTGGPDQTIVSTTTPAPNSAGRDASVAPRAVEEGAEDDGGISMVWILAGVAVLGLVVFGFAASQVMGRRARGRETLSA